MKPTARVYYALTTVMLAGVTACARGLTSIAPSGALAPTPRDTIEAWLAAYRPAGPVRYDLRWRFVNQKGSTAGRAAVRIAPPDTLRFDYRGPFGRSGAAMVVADSALWVAPERDTREMLPAAPVFWAALGIPQPPPDHATVSSRAGGGRVWRYAFRADTMDFVEIGPGPEQLLTEVRREGKIVASTEVRFRPGDRVPVDARVRFPQDGSALIISVEGVASVDPFDPSTWRRP